MKINVRKTKVRCISKWVDNNTVLENDDWRIDNIASNFIMRMNLFIVILED